MSALAMLQTVSQKLLPVGFLLTNGKSWRETGRRKEEEGTISVFSVGVTTAKTATTVTKHSHGSSP
jgi:hypothetical protein